MVTFGSNVGGFMSGMGLVTAGLVGVSAAIGESVKSAGDFQAGITNLSTAAGENVKSLGMVGDGIKKVAVDTGTGTKDLIAAMFMIESSGQHGAAGLRMLQVAAQGAKTDNAELMVVSKALTGVMTGWPQTLNGAAGGMNELIAASSLGKMHLQDLSKAMGNVIPIATNAGVSFADVGAAVAMMTNKNMTAQRASANIAFALRDLSAPSGIAQKAMASVGLSAQDLKDSLSTKGLGPTLQMVTTAIGKTFPSGSIEATTALKNIMGGASGLNVALALGGKNLSTYEAGVKKVADAARNGGQSVEGWSTVQGNFNTKMDRAKAAIEVLGINIGTKLLPVLGNIVSAITPIISKFADWISTGDRLKQFFDDTSPKMVAVKIALIALAGVLGGLAVAALVAFAVAAWAAILPLLPFIAIGALVALAIAGIILIITHWGAICTWVGGVFSGLGSLVRGVATDIKNAVGGAFDALGSKVRGAITGLKNDVGGIFNALGTQMRDSATKVKNDVGQKFDDMGTQMRNSATKVKNDVGGAMSAVGTTVHNAGVGAVEAGKWMYAHNVYWKAACDDVGKFFSQMGNNVHQAVDNVRNWVGGAFDWIGSHVHEVVSALVSAVGGFFSRMGQGIQNAMGKIKAFVGGAFDWLGTHVSAVVSAMVSAVGGFFSNMGQGVQNTMEKIKSNITDKIGEAVGNLMSGMGSMISGAAGKLGELGGNFMSAMGSLASQAVSWGANIIQGIIDGISSMLGNLAGMVGQAAATVGNFLGFHSPTKEGEGRNLMSWGPALVKTFAAGVDASAPLLHASLNHLIQAPANPLIGASGGGGGSSSGNNGPVTINLIVDGRTLAKALGPHMASEIRLVTGVSR